MLNRVSRAQEVFIFLRKLLSKTENSPALSLLHSRFRKNDRQKTDSLLSEILKPDRIIITTQVLEAGVDVSARTLITELAPWSSMVQRFGRCNRYGEYSEGEVFWINLVAEQPENKLESNSLPYTTDSLKRASELLRKLENVSPESLARVQYNPELEVFHIPRKRDILQLFDTAPHLSGMTLEKLMRLSRTCWEILIIQKRKFLPSQQPGKVRNHAISKPELEFRNDHFSDMSLHRPYGIWHRRILIHLLPTLLPHIMAKSG
jgi:CRISPR/Cas system-associated endonuclease/helicase Cas3